MPSTAPSASPPGPRRSGTGDWGWEEFEVNQQILQDALARMSFPATKRELARRILSRADHGGVPPASVHALPERRYESLEDVKYTLDALGAFPHPTR